MKNYLKWIFLFIVAFIAIPLFAQDVPVDPVDPEPAFNVWTIISGVLAVLGTVFATAFVKIKKKIGQFVNLAKQAVELLTVVTDAIGDNTVTKEEIAAMKQEIADVKAAWRVLWNKV